MSETYLVRAKLEWKWDEESQDLKLPSWDSFDLGQFKIVRSPNIELYLFNLGLIEPDSLQELPVENKDYPISYLYVETEIEVAKSGMRYQVADETLSQLEALMRLFQRGGVYLRRHKIWVLDRGRPEVVISIRFPPDMHPKPEPAPLYERPGYDMSDEKLDEFKKFFDLYWQVVQKRLPLLDIALNRFSSSYDRRPLADRLIDLMIAMEALFGNQTEVTHKVALRSACMRFPPGEAREKAFYQIKKLYGERSRLIHGKWLTPKSAEEEVEAFEGHVRQSIIKFMDLHKQGVNLNSEKEFDKFLFFTKRDK